MKDSAREKREKVLAKIVAQPNNTTCFDCLKKGVSYANMTIGTFVCMRCSGILRGISPSHRMKSVTICSFSAEEIDFLSGRGNDVMIHFYPSGNSGLACHSADSKQLKNFLTNKYNKRLPPTQNELKSIPSYKVREEKVEHCENSNRKNDPTLLLISDIAASLIANERSIDPLKLSSTSSDSAKSALVAIKQEVVKTSGGEGIETSLQQEQGLIDETLNLFKTTSTDAVKSDKYEDAQRILADDLEKLFY